MTQQFKFGDIVRRKSDGATGVVIHAQFQSVWFVIKGNLTVNADYAEEFEIIPHPDTVRLEFVVSKYGTTLSHARDVIDKEMK